MPAGSPRVVAALLSLLVPGLGQWARGERAKGAAMVCITIGLWIFLVRSSSVFNRLVYGLIYVAILIVAVQDAARPPSGTIASSDRAGYVIWMLLAAGPFALPLLWQSGAFSRRAKTLWSLAVILIAILLIAAVELLGPWLEALLGGVPLP